MSFAPIKGSYSDGFRKLVSDMLQKAPESRPTSNDLYTQRVVELMVKEEEEMEEDDPPDITKTK